MNKIEKIIRDIFYQNEFCNNCGNKCEDNVPCHYQETLNKIESELNEKIKGFLDE